MTAANLTVSDLETAATAANYQDWLLRRFHPYLGQRILDAGAGIGAITEHLLDRELVLPTDAYPPYLDLLRQRIGHRLKVEPVAVDLADPAIRELAHHRFDTVLCTNVLEHVEDDRAALANFHALLQPGGRLVLYVPAHQFLYGPVDEQLDHFRRYSRRDVRRKLREAGFAVEHLSEMHLLGIVGWFLSKRVQRRRAVSPRQLGLYDKWVVPWMERVERVVPPPIGLSVFAVARKDGSAASSVAG